MRLHQFLHLLILIVSVITGWQLGLFLVDWITFRIQKRRDAAFWNPPPRKL